MTPRGLITLALKQVGVVGIGQPARPEYLADGLTLLNMMLAQWAQRRWLVYHLQDVSFPATGALSYSIGPGGNVDIPRPDRIQAVYARMNPAPRNDGFILDVSQLDVGVLDPDQSARGAPGASSLDYPMDLLDSYEDYSAIGFKAMAGVPGIAFYDSGWPLGALYVWPVPGPAYELHMLVKQPLTSVGSLEADMMLPDEYQEAVLHNLTARLAPVFQVKLDPTVMALGMAALATIRTNNTQVSRLRMPGGLPGMGYGRSSGYGGYGGIGPIGAPAILTGTSADTVSPLPPPSVQSAVLGQGALGQMILGH